MGEARVIELIRPFDPTSEDAEDQYDNVVRRINRVRVRRARVERERDELVREFVDDDLQVRDGQRKGQPLSRQGRRRRLERLLDLDHETRHLRSEEQFSADALDRMNAELDRWARETYGP